MYRNLRNVSWGYFESYSTSSNASQGNVSDRPEYNRYLFNIPKDQLYEYPEYSIKYSWKNNTIARKYRAGYPEPGLLYGFKGWVITQWNYSEIRRPALNDLCSVENRTN